jgi:molybdate transport system ATP-binding protein
VARLSLQVQLNWQREDFTLRVDLDLPGRGVTGLLGPSGSGKTSLLRAIAGLERVPGACVRINGETWQDGAIFLPVHQRALGYVFQQPSLFPHLDVRRNLEFGFSRLPPAQRRISLPQVIEWLGLEPLLARNTEDLSGGEAQRVAIARALAVSPQLLLLDEPLASWTCRPKPRSCPTSKPCTGNWRCPCCM